MTSDASISAPLAFALKLGIALATTTLLVANVWLRRLGQPERLRRSRDGLLLALGLTGGLGWWYFLGIPLVSWVHDHDFYHYFLGARYFPELGYTRLYVCTLAADQEAGAGPPLETRRLRNLETNVLELGATAKDEIAACKTRFTPERWRAFSADVAWFRQRQPAAKWPLTQMDHGFNGSPVWLLAGSLLTGTTLGVGTLVGWLTKLDPLLLLAMWTGVVSGFGWRAACVAAVFWGTNGFASFDWTGGSFLRQDWLVALVLGLVCIRRERPTAAGALLTLSALLRVFPAVAVAVLALKSGLDAMRAGRWRPSPDQLRFAFGCVLVLALALPVTTLRSSESAWTGFVANSGKLLETPLLNQMGLRGAVIYERDTRSALLENRSAIDAYLDWKVAQKQQLAERWWIVAGLGALYLGLLVRALRSSEDWVALALGTGAIPIATQLTCYYHVVLIGLALLWLRREEAGVAVCALAAVTQLLEYRIPYSDERYAWMSLAEIATVFFVTWLCGNRGHESAAPISSAARSPLVSAHSV